MGEERVYSPWVAESFVDVLHDSTDVSACLLQQVPLLDSTIHRLDQKTNRPAWDEIKRGDRKFSKWKFMSCTKHIDLSSNL